MVILPIGMTTTVLFCVFFYKQNTAYEMRISDWSSDVCSSDLSCSDSTSPPSGLSPDLFSCRSLSPYAPALRYLRANGEGSGLHFTFSSHEQIGSASCRERVCQYV